jgi:CRP/FNR family transcriptional regulator, cyclic AMP receptor protein
MSEDAAVARLLRSSPVLGVLSPEGVARLAAAGRVQALQPGQVLCHRGDPGDACFVVLQGEIEAVAADAEGRQVWLASLIEGAVIGEMAVLDGGPRSATLVCVRRARLFRIDRDPVLAVLRAEPEAALALLAVLVQRLRRTDALAESLAFRSIAARLAQLLLGQGEGAVALTQGRMGELIGASRERVNRTLAAWRAQGWVALGRSGVRVLDRAALAGVTREDKA